MRFKLVLQIKTDVTGNEIPINYQYPLQSVIYKVLSKSDEQFSSWLHDNGYQQEGKRFKLFSFSNLLIPRFDIDKERERLIIKSDTISLILSFLPDKGTQQFIKGLFADQNIEIADYISGASFSIREIQMLEPLNNYNPDIIFRTLSPVSVSLQNDQGKIDYIKPGHPNYENCLLENLLSRYKAFFGKDFEGEKYCHLTLLSEPKSALVRIKAGTPSETRVRGYRYTFKINLPEPLMQIAYESGLGEKGSMGFGMIEKFNHNNILI